jgi:hypothetical protein
MSFGLICHAANLLTAARSVKTLGGTSLTSRYAFLMGKFVRLEGGDETFVKQNAPALSGGAERYHFFALRRWLNLPVTLCFFR